MEHTLEEVGLLAAARELRQRVGAGVGRQAADRIEDPATLVRSAVEQPLHEELLGEAFGCGSP